MNSKYTKSPNDIRTLLQSYVNKTEDGLEFSKENIPEEVSSLYKEIEDAPFLINKVAISDYKRVRDLFVSIDKKLTVFVGDNGYGKTTILEALFIALSWFRANVQKEDKSGFHIKDGDINNHNDVNYAAITAQFKLKKITSNILVTRVKDGVSQKRHNELLSIKEMASFFRVVNSYYEDVSLPVLAYYSVSRSSNGAGIDNKRNVNNSVRRWTKLDAYEDIEFDRRDFGEFLNWFIFVNNKALSEESLIPEKQRDQLVIDISKLKVSLEVLKSFSDVDRRTLIDIETQITNKELILNTLPSTPNGLSRSKDIVANVKRAIINFLPEISSVELQYTENEVRLVLAKDDLLLDAQQLSQGEKTILTLVGDLTRRLVLLNPKLNNPLQGKGIVLIDEVDLHLHPSWQQNIIEKLQHTFPNVQFIITTHSPQIVSTVPSKCLRILEEIKNPSTGMKELRVLLPSSQTKGTKNSYALLYGMKTDPVPNVKEVAWLSTYKKFIENRQQDSEEAIMIRKKLDKHYGIDHPLLLECDGIIRVLKLKDKVRGESGNKESKQ
ncbi:TPA: AAA family ATPase [Escherichia coli]|nr:AAA family ATPase [Escherichia coli]HAO3456538.1 AAA family ATPase [Escherichia coli]HAO3461464.1 AAA family ATPase [Escherichia coli]HAO3480862.1 AAA family ATPase [Escherichia coli]HAP0465769.1 AAA family ATPase [Escherichia coli]